MLGIPHPPGNPLFVILAHTFGLLPLGGVVRRADQPVRGGHQRRSAPGSGFWWPSAGSRGIVQPRWARYGAAFGGVLVGATSWSVWNQSTVNEKVYTVSLLSIALVMWLVVRWGDDEPGPHRDRWLVLDRLRAGAHLDQPPDGLPRRPPPCWSTCSGPTGAR